MAQVKVSTLEVDGVEYEYPQERLLTAVDTQFDKTIENILAATNVQDAIDEISTNVGSASRALTFCQYNGNAGSGRFLEFFSGIDSNIAPIYTPVALKILLIVLGATSASTGSISFYNNTTLLYTINLSAAAQSVASGTSASPVFTVPAGAYLKVKVSSGSITKPHLYFVAQGG